MKTISFSIIVITAWSAFAYKLRDLLRDPSNLTLRALCTTFGLMGAAMTLAVPPVGRPLEQATGVFLFWTIVPVSIALGSLQVTALLWTYPLEEARPRIRRRLVIYGCAVVIMSILTLLAPIDPTALSVGDSDEKRELLLYSSPYTAEAMLIFLAVFGLTAGDVSWQTMRYRRLVDRRWLRRGLGLVGLTGALNGVYWLTKSTHVVSLRYFDTFLETLYQIGPAILAIATSSAFVGWTMPAWGPRLDRFLAYHRLSSLWRALSRVTPEIVLETEGMRSSTHWWRISDLDFLLYRRIIEIRDSRLALRPYLDQDVAAEARELGQETGLEGEALQAAIEAATLAAAVQAKAEGRPKARRPIDNTSMDLDLADEVIWFTQVAQAFARLPSAARKIRCAVPAMSTEAPADQP